MGHFKLFEQFMNEAKLSDYNLDGPTSPKYDKFIAEAVGPTIIKVFKKEGFKSLNDKPITRYSLYREFQTFEFEKKIDGKEYVFAYTLCTSSGLMNCDASFYLNYTKPAGWYFKTTQAPGYLQWGTGRSQSIGIDKVAKLKNGELIDELNKLIPDSVESSVELLINVIKNKDLEFISGRAYEVMTLKNGLLTSDYTYAPDMIK